MPIKTLPFGRKNVELFLHVLKMWQLEKKWTLSFLLFLFTFLSDITVETGMPDDIMYWLLFAIMFVWFIQ